MANISQLTTLATQGNHAATATLELHIRNLCPSKDPSDDSPNWVFDPDAEKWVDQPPPYSPEVKIAEEKMQAMLQVAIASLINLQSLKWRIGGYDSKWTPTAVINAAKTLPLLESLELIVEKTFDMADLRLESLRNLQIIKISSPNNDSFVKTIEPLSLLIVNSPNLHTLHLGPTYSSKASLHRLLRNCPPSLVLPLKHLGLQGFSLKLDRLKKLRLAPTNFETQEESDPAANQFYNLCLGKHTSTLEELIVIAEYEGGWCFGDQALVVISQCKKLKILEGSLVSGALDDAVKSLVDVTTQLPRIEKLTVHPADLKRDFRWNVWANPMMSHVQHVTTQLLGCIREYEATESSKPVPSIFVDSREFTLAPSEGAGSAGGALRYQCDSD
ncbi:uncharacterized protein LACBIDRAFT_316166 [Laccaria bicolor S238N-H82]|uniref:Predicted protein n=1 Tax=Laccaria bicolor (strain S238N-H82 / ATCC MYA-4686) TaxID=486041 RepID=B0E0B8_LACBS|nr:uncharacterized protein LACBIDRAFT_316166 [Laccaria bicolor S238N-H82]EDQ99656.1 predicted protein [Laccaria bicolor S238N-H82]|eukprot:XP_001889633.1 predicted protein [Laccaria bicolor S238N-H82]